MNEEQFISKIISIQKSMLRYALKLTHNIDDANDLRQETTLNALSHKDQYIENNSFSAWVFRIMKNHFINNYRSAIKERKMIEGLSKLDLRQIYYNTSVYTQLGKDDLLKMVNELDDIYRIPFLMNYNGHKYYEIANELNIPMGTVKSRINEARKQLKTMFAKLNVK